jgi:anti-sigma factor (TIGR02949 family)
MRCDDVKRVIYFFLDGSLGPGKRRDFDEHLHLCHDCEQRTTLSRRLRLFILRHLSPDSAPTRLKIRLTRVLRAVDGD